MKFSAPFLAVQKKEVCGDVHYFSKYWVENNTFSASKPTKALLPFFNVALFHGGKTPIEKHYLVFKNNSFEN